MPRLPKDPCIELMVNASGGNMTKTEAKEVLDQLQSFLDDKKKTSIDLNMADALREEAMRIIQDKKKQALQDYAGQIYDKKILADRSANIAGYEKKRIPGQMFWDSFVGGVRSIFGSKDSVDVNRKAIFVTTFGNMLKKMQKAGAYDLYTSHKYDLQIMRELEMIGTKERPSVTGDAKKFRDIAEAIHEAQGELVARARRAHVYIDQIPGYMVKQVNNVEKMKGAGQKQWIADKLADLDPRTYKGADPQKFLESAWEAIISGERRDSSAPGYGSGTQNLAKKMAEERVFHYKDADAAFRHMQKYGQGTVADSVAQSLQMTSNALGLIEKWGHNPENNWQTLRKELQQKYRGDEKALKSLKSPTIDAAWNVIKGSPSADNNIADAGRFIRMWQFLSKLGFAVKYGVTVDPATGWMQMVHEGKPFFQAIYDAVQSRAKMLSRAGDAKEIQQNLLSHTEGTLASSSRFAPGTDDFTGFHAKAIMAFSKATGMHSLDMINRGGFEGELTNFLARGAKSDFSKLSETRKRRLGEFSITEQDWNLLRKAIYKSSTGNEYMQVQMIREKVPESAIKAELEAAGKKATEDSIQRRYDELETKLGTYITDGVDRSIFRGGAAEQALLGRLYGSQERGTLRGEASRIGYQFKSYPLAAFRKGLLPHAMDGGVMGVAKFIASTTVMAYATIALEDLVRGTDPRDRDFLDLKYQINAMAKGGGLGIYGDFLFGQASLWEGVAGPTFGPVAKLIDAAKQSASEGDIKTFKDEYMRDARAQIPFQNFWMSKMMLDYAIAYQLQEYLNPGFLNRMETNRANRGQPKFFVPPTSVIPYGGGEHPLVPGSNLVGE